MFGRLDAAPLRRGKDAPSASHPAPEKASAADDERAARLQALAQRDSLGAGDGKVRHDSAVSVAGGTRRIDVSGKSRRARLLGRALRMPSVLDRKRTHWMLQALSPVPVIVLVHRGRKSGRVYKTPLEIMIDHPWRGEFVVAPMWGKDSDWYRNVVAGGLIELHVRGEARQVEWRELDEAERRAAMDAYRQAHPLYSRIILRMVVFVNGLEGDPEQAVLRELPVLALRRSGS
jgi:deazaflavin-dependent oxidoreductase (nitroreductase family)